MCSALASVLVNVLWRTLLVTLRAKLRVRGGGHRPLTEVHRIRLRVLPTDIDMLRHLNNGRYLSLFDLGRWDMLERTGLTGVLRARRWYPVVSSETITFRKSLGLWQRFDLETRWIGRDDRALYMEHRAVVGGEVYARAIIRARLLGPGGPVAHDDLFAAVEVPEGLPEVAAWIHDWADASALPSTRRPAPSVWD
ncbi:acyl-CoA thioesterase [Microbacterium betulae]|uniref:Acyl-CoA thioesterase n=1 Tax=Microbacterium betulae TaxID=2981139 RepID=A0AA97I7J5_9MICO|nr:acyl-CoA thioesterase [Microbacterium sp. AB]WOF23505.1 acyl-CoA thioesterase [Microbacterium sp. AB]